MPTNPNMVAIQTVTVGSGGASSIEFTNIPQTYTDLYLVTSLRTTATGQQYFTLTINNDNGSNKYNQKTIRGDGSTVDVYYSGLNTFFYSQALDNNTSNTFNNSAFYIPNYTSSNKKSISFDGVGEDNATNTFMTLIASLYDSTSAITSLKLASGANFAQYSTATLYGVTSAGYGAKATGGIISQDANYYYHTFLASGTFTPTSSISADVLVVAGGGGGALDTAGGGGAGGLLGFTSQSLSATNYTITVGAGGAGRTSTAGFGSDGSNSQFGALTACVGGGGGAPADNNGRAGGSGGGAGGNNPVRSGGTATSGQGFAGGSGQTTNYPWGGGGGGAGEAGNTDGAQYGGDGVTTYSSWGLATTTGENVNGTVWYAGGGVGATTLTAEGGLGGGGTQGRVNGLSATGGGGGASSGNGGSGVVIVRYAK